MAQPHKTSERILKKLRARYAADRKIGRQRARNARAERGDVINLRRRELAAQRRTAERERRWAAYQQDPPGSELPWNEQLRSWFEAQPKFATKRQLASEVGVSVRSVMDWFRGKHPPEGPRRRKLHEITQLECFRSSERRPKYADQTRTAPALLKDLVEKCGLSSRELRRLEVSNVEAKGIRIPTGRLIPFGNEWHQVREAAVREWVAIAHPTSYLFFRLKPVDRNRPATAKWIVRMSRKAGISLRRSQSPRVRHFAVDAKRFGAGPRFLTHLKQVHGLSRTHSRAVWKELIEKSVKVGSKQKAPAIAPRRGRPATKRHVFLEAKRLHAAGTSWADIAKKLVPEEFRKDWRAAKERIRIGVTKLGKDKSPVT